MTPICSNVPKHEVLRTQKALRTHLGYVKRGIIKIKYLLKVLLAVHYYFQKLKSLDSMKELFLLTLTHLI